MLHSLFPKAHRKFLSLPLLGPIADGFDDWLAANGYTRDSRANSIRMLKQVDADLRRRHVKEVGGLTHLILHDCWRTQNLSLYRGNCEDTGKISGRDQPDCFCQARNSKLRCLDFG
jgi:hypothetical protein